MAEAVAPFDVAAPTYDVDFTERRLGRWLREAVWAELEPLLRPGDRVLELGCGTGEDALWLARHGCHVTATDLSPEMLAVAQRKAQAAGLAGRIGFAPLDLRAPVRPPTWGEGQHADVVLSNFGALNCVEDRGPLVEALGRWVASGGTLALVGMSPVCPWEIGWLVAHGQPRTALRRLRSGGVAKVGSGRVKVWYPSPMRLRREFAPYFRHLRTVGVGALLPPSYLAHLVDRWPRPFARVARWDRRLGRWFPLTWLNDHFLLLLARR